MRAALIAVVAVGAVAGCRSNTLDDTPHRLSFQPPVYVTVPGMPRALVGGDFRGLGHVDLAIGTSGAPGVLLVPNHGNATFGDVLSTTSSEVVGLGTADFNGDGRADLALAHGDDESLLLGNGDGTFQPAVHILPSPIAAEDVHVTDINLDGRPDLVLSRTLPPGASTEPSGAVCINGGAIGFQAVSTIAGVGITGVVANDWNHDGIVDLALTDALTGALVVADRSQGGQVRTTPLSSPRALAGADLDGDGDLDLVAADTGAPDGAGHVGADVLLADAGGHFPTVTTSPAGSSPIDVAIADLDGDGHPDIVTVDAAAAMLDILLGAGDGTFGAPIVLRLGYVPDRAGALLVRDLDHDGRPDLVALDRAGGRFVLFVNASW